MNATSLESHAIQSVAKAIEVSWTSGGLDKLEVYRLSNVPEVWIRKDANMQMFGLVGERYEPLQQSQFVPGLKLEQLLPFIEVMPMTRAVREYRAALKRG